MKLADDPGNPAVRAPYRVGKEEPWSQVQDRRHNEHQDGQHDQPAPDALSSSLSVTSLSHLIGAPSLGTRLR